MNGWPTVPFGELASTDRWAFSIGPFGSSVTTADYQHVGIPFIRGVNLAKGIFNDGEFVFISDKKADEVQSAAVLPGDLVFTRKGTIGQVSMIPRDARFMRYVISGSQMKARLDPTRAVAEFFYYWFRSPAGQQSILSHAVTVGVPSIANSLATLKSITVPVPPISVQSSIAEILGALDDKIAVNERIVAGIDMLLDARFSAGLQQGAREVKLGELISLRYGKALKEEFRTRGTVPVFGGNGISGWHDVPLDSGPGIIVGRKGANAGSVSWSQGPFWAIDTSFYVKPAAIGIPLQVLYFILYGAGLRGLVGDSAIPGLNRDMALSCTVKLPGDDAIVRLAEIARPMLDLSAKMIGESRVLAEVRDALLPKLMSGEIRVRDAEKIVEDVT